MNDLRIMLVDDDSGILVLLSRILEKMGYRKLVTFNSGQLALEYLKTNKDNIDIIMSDLNMPEMSGVKLLRHISEQNYSGGIILVSAEDERVLETAKYLAKALSLNILGYLSKPLNKEVLQLLLLKYSQQDIEISNSFEETISEKELRSGIDEDRLLMAFQPKISLATNQIEGVEALARWNHHTRGLLYPYTFIPLAESCHLIHELTFDVYRKSLSQLKIWMESDYSLKMSINISVNSFSKEGCADFLIKTAEEYNIEPALIILEITENQIMENSLDCVEVLMQLRMQNFGLSIDDFGTGHSSMAQLKNIPFTELKIDRSFVDGADENSSSRSIIESSVDLAKKLKMKTVAEGVETKEEMALVKALGCDQVQGYFVAKPMFGHDLEKFIQSCI